ncbi:hypothetical protein OPW36_18465 [Vibrio europaeus]|uniref:Uncharacterized protein n=1 Tax=Vibrio europaeus TaxID=300876 RepID=A0AAE7AZ39_9VIBR|nr:hypothetical protein [Vibrio europaeus]MDC5805213.1 hypothetical protein [Vibrio europaeus]MDC5811482.1 hypothetical protein [Vibrio europaeus]MDC5826712.1 hypothetical protein [Vibrio europaeus]MDC5832078.1 hypothetical protein [Vibrio europaeus]MDC5835033.1 hypothetical protein [Vibrio europaeus]
MEVVQVLPILATVFSGVAVLVSYLNVTNAQKSEIAQIEKLNLELSKRLTELEKVELVKLRNEIVHHRDVNELELERARKLLVSIIQELHDSELEGIDSRLNQSSPVGKIRYTDKVISLTDFQLDKHNKLLKSDS